MPQPTSHYLSQWWPNSMGIKPTEFNRYLSTVNDFEIVFDQTIIFNSLRPLDAIWRQRFGSTLVQVVVWCHQATSHFLSNVDKSSVRFCGIHLREISQECSIYIYIYIYVWYEFGNHLFKTTAASPTRSFEVWQDLQLGSVSISDKSSYRKISWDLETARLVV